jgi:hypothetical protein
MTTKEHLERHDKHDREIAAIRKLVLQGTRMVSDYHQETRAYVRESRKEMRELREAQKRTEASLKAFIDTMRGVGNGHAKGKVDLR